MCVYIYIYVCMYTLNMCIYTYFWIPRGLSKQRSRRLWERLGLSRPLSLRRLRLDGRFENLGCPVTPWQKMCIYVYTAYICSNLHILFKKRHLHTHATTDSNDKTIITSIFLMIDLIAIPTIVRTYVYNIYIYIGGFPKQVF